MWKKLFILGFAVSIILLSGEAVFSGSSQIIWDGIKITNGGEFYINSIKELQALEGFKDIQLKASMSAVESAGPEGSVKGSQLQITKAGETIFTISSFNIYDPNGVVADSILQCVPADPNESTLSCNYMMNKSGKIGYLAVAQQEPSGWVGILRENSKRWHLFQYTCNSKVSKRPYHDIYFDIDFDGYLDVRYVVDNASKKIAITYIMYDLDWIKVANFDVYKEVPEAIETTAKGKTKYKYTNGLWLIEK